MRRDTAANWTSANPTLAAGEVGFETNTGKFKIGDGSTAWASLTYFIPGVGAGGSTIATDTLWDTKGDLAAATGADTAVKLAVGSNYDGLHADSGQTTGLRWTPGSSILLYDYTVAGSDKASIDTGVDTPDAGIAGTAAFPALRLLEILIQARSDNAAAASTLNITLNNDTGSNYEFERQGATNTTASAAPQAATTAWAIGIHGTGGSASRATPLELLLPNYAGTAFHKSGFIRSGLTDATAGNNQIQKYVVNYLSTSAVTRVKIAGGGTDKLKVGSRISVYAR